MSQLELRALRIIAQRQEGFADARKKEWHQALRSLGETLCKAGAHIVPLVKESIDAYNSSLGERRIDTECGLYVNIDLDSMQVSVTFDIFYPQLGECGNEKIPRMTQVEERKVASFLSKDLSQRLAKAGYELKVGEVEYNRDM